MKTNIRTIIDLKREADLGFLKQIDTSYIFKFLYFCYLNANIIAGTFQKFIINLKNATKILIICTNYIKNIVYRIRTNHVVFSHRNSNLLSFLYCLIFLTRHVFYVLYKTFTHNTLIYGVYYCSVLLNIVSAIISYVEL